MENLINKELRKELPNLISNKGNIVITKGRVGGHSIEVENKMDSSFESFIYYKRDNLRDQDYNELMKLLK